MATIADIWKQKNTPNRLDLDLLLSSSLKQPKEFLYTHPEYTLSLVERLRLAYFLFLYKRGFSVAVITHRKEFYGLDFYVNKHTLIPRPETELMVEEVTKTIGTIYPSPSPSPKRGGTQGGVLLIDIGTGSGCIPIAIIKTLKHRNIKTIAIDISRAALHVARKNARTHNVFINFLHGNLLDPIIKNPAFFIRHSSFIITANLPYLTQEQFDSEPSIQREPYSALVAKNDGLALYQQLLAQIQSLCFMFHISCFIFFEIDPSQSSAITAMIQKYLPDATIEIKKDLAGYDRLVKIQIQKYGNDSQ